MRSIRALMTGLAFLAGFTSVAALASGKEALQIEAKIMLRDVPGRLAGFAIDLRRHRLYIAAEDQGRVIAVDLRTRKVVDSIRNLAQPQQILYIPERDELVVTTAGDGAISLFKGASGAPTGIFRLRGRPTAVQYNPASAHLLVAHHLGPDHGAIALMDLARGHILADMPLGAQASSIRMASDGRVFVGLSNARHGYGVVILDQRDLKRRARWPIWPAGARNISAMAVDERHDRLLTLFQNPGRLAAFSLKDGTLRASMDACGPIADPSDHVFLDANRGRIYATCNSGWVDVFDPNDGYRRIERVATARGGGPALFAPELDRLFVVAHSGWTTPAGIFVLRPRP